MRLVHPHTRSPAFVSADVAVQIGYRADGIFAAAKREGKQTRKSSAVRRASVQVFEQFDKDGDGKLGEDDLRKMVREYAMGTFPVSNVTFAALYREMNTDHTGVSIDRFCSYLTQTDAEADADASLDDPRVKALEETRMKLIASKYEDTRDFIDPESLTTLNAETPALRTNVQVLKKYLKEHVSSA